MDNKTDDKAPSLGQFSSRAVNSAVLKEGLTHPLTLYPPALGVLSALAGALFSAPAFFALAIGAGIVGIGTGVVNLFFRNEALANKYLKKLALLQEAHERRVVASLRTDLEKCLQNPAIAEYAKRGVEQFDRCRIKFKNVEDLLEKKLNLTEITYSRFQSAAKQVYLSLLDNLQTVAAVLESAGTIDKDYIRSRLRSLSAKKTLSPAEKKEAETLKQRYRLMKSQLDMAAELLSGNEEAMTRLEETTSNIALMKTKGRFAQTDFETAIDYLQDLAKSAHEYNIKPVAIEKV